MAYLMCYKLRVWFVETKWKDPTKMVFLILGRKKTSYVSKITTLSSEAFVILI